MTPVSVVSRAGSILVPWRFALPAHPSTMKASTIDKFTWPLIYGGILLLLLGIATVSADAALGWAIAIAGSVLAVIGVFTIYLRSRIKD